MILHHVFFGVKDLLEEEPILAVAFCRGRMPTLLHQFSNHLDDLVAPEYVSPQFVVGYPIHI